MASASNRVDTFAIVAPLAIPLTIGGAGYAAWRADWKTLIQSFLTGPGRTSRILLLVFMIFNWKNLPFAWTYRVFYSVINNHFLRRSPNLGPRALYKPIISETYAPLLEIDYNLHKSNSTFFTDLDITRTHLVSYLFRSSMRRLAHNSKSKLVLDPQTGAPMKGALGILLGSVECSFKKEVAPYQSYELWSRVLCWDRKWVFILTHFVPKGTAKPTEWLDPRYGKVRTRGPKDAAGGWERKIIATAISKYVFKVGRLTVHPALILGDSGLLPERPGGWMGGENQVGDESVDLEDVDLSTEGEWDWRRTEAQRREGMKLAASFDALESAHGMFDGGNTGALARVWPG